jgi:sigma-B regulation protein RsbU (phosphoserine phosphatase)
VLQAGLPTETLPDAGAAGPELARASWQERLSFVVDTMRELSRQTDPQLMVQTYAQRMRLVLATDGFVALSRRGLEAPRYRITRSSLWDEDINPWKQADRLPMFDRGLLGRLIYGNEPVIIDDLQVDPDDPAASFLDGNRSLVAVPVFDGGVALNMTVLLKKEPGAFKREDLPERVWMSNLFGRATQNLVLMEEVQRAYDIVDRELKVVGDIQRSLLPTTLPAIPTLDLAATYQTSQRAGGDYYDFFPLPGGQWGVLIADVSGHGTPAAVLMAVTHSIAHTLADPKGPPSRLLSFVNRRLAAAYTTDNGSFVTAFYGVYDPANRRLSFSNAGHPPPRVRQANGDSVVPLHAQPGLPLGIDPAETYDDFTADLTPGDTLVLYTDGITEARTPAGDLLGMTRFDDILSRCTGTAAEMAAQALAAVDRFTEGGPFTDDRTLLVARVS